MGTTLQDDITKANARICKHMNDDHKISIIAYCDYYGGLLSQVEDAELTGLDSEAMTVDVTFVGGGKRVLQIPYTRKPKAVADIRPIVVEMHKEAFKMLGLRYRLEKGYYQQVAEILSGVAKKKWRSAPTSKKIAVVATVAGVGYIAFAVVQRLRRR
jgi:hypothetical protein